MLRVFKNTTLSEALSNRKKISAGILAVLIPALLLFSIFFSAFEADHDCTGEDCPICACIQQCENTVRGLGNGVLTQPFFLLPAAGLSSALAYTAISCFVPATLVSWKVRLDD